MKTRHSPPTLSQVAKRAGVAVSTASAILRDEVTCYASDETRQRVRQAAAQLNYRRNSLAAALRTRSSGTIGVLLPGIGGVSVYAEKLAVLESYASDANYRMIFATHRNDTDRAISAMLDFDAQFVDGLILSLPRIRDDEVDSLKQVIRNTRAPVVTMDSRVDLGTCDVSVDREAGGYMQVTHLLRQGRRNLAFLIVGTSAPTVLRRVEGYHRALHEAGMRMDDQQQILIDQDDFFESCVREMSTAIERGIKFDGLVGSSDLVAAAAMRAMADAGLRIPEDVAVIGFDDDIYAPALVTPLSSIRQPREAGRHAFELLQDQINQRDDKPAGETPRRIVLSPELVVRRSTTVHSHVSPECAQQRLTI